MAAGIVATVGESGPWVVLNARQFDPRAIDRHRGMSQLPNVTQKEENSCMQIRGICAGAGPNLTWGRIVGTSGDD
jgi:hypothetical protein